MIKAILFDLEGTLINVDSANFIRNFVGILAPRFAHLLSPDKFSKQLLKSLESVENEDRPEQTNMQTLYDDFSKATGHSGQSLRPVFNEFYESDFSTLKCLVQAAPQGVKVIEYVLQRGYLTAAASNPALPLQVMQEYLSWAGLKPEHFKIIPGLDNFHYFKPQLGFFQELADSLSVKPENCLLVSAQSEDLVCTKLGMKVFFIGSAEATGLAEYVGSLDDFYQLIVQGHV